MGNKDDKKSSKVSKKEAKVVEDSPSNGDANNNSHSVNEKLKGVASLVPPNNDSHSGVNNEALCKDDSHPMTMANAPNLMNQSHMSAGISALPQGNSMLYQQSVPSGFPNQWPSQYFQPMAGPYASLGYPGAHAQSDIGNNKRVDALEANVNKILEIISKNAQGTQNFQGNIDNNTQNLPSDVQNATMQYENVSDDQEEGEYRENSDFSMGDNGASCSNSLDDSFEKAFSANKVVPSVDQSVADMVNKACTESPSEEFFQNLMAKYDRPENCDKVCAPELDKKLFNTSIAGSKDINFMERRLFSIQEVLAHSLHANIRLMDMLTAFKKQDPDCEVTKEMFDIVRSSTFLAGHASFKMSLLRRENIKKLLDERNTDVVDHIRVPITSRLMGDDFVKSCKEAAENKSALTRVLKKPVQSFSRPSYASSNGRFQQNRQNFRGNNNYLRGVRPAFNRGTSRGRYNSGGRGRFNSRSQSAVSNAKN